ncbi:hypothetical protein [Ammoniphilus sp. YIM 78166]|uniref:hypothetical protein n=1 Tax=Ammoniphilus sp. YIM 78166 TaxID=1644106 RepID=UPI001070485B|nr:hypothetical protein [Ammoniphilus sp. YIM 78166]
MKKIVIAIVIIFLISILLYLSGYRLDGLSAARANSFISKDSVLLDEVEYSWGKVFIFNSPEKPVTAISSKSFGFLWVSRMSVYYYPNKDLIKTIGGVSYVSDQNKATTVISVWSSDPKISYIEIGPEGNRIRKEAILNSPITFSWDKSFQWNDLKPQAFNKDGKVIYEYRYAKSNFIKHEDLKWYPVLQDEDQEKSISN